VGQDVGKEDSELVRQARQGAGPEAEQAFAALVRRWQLPLFRFVHRRVRAHHDAEEVLAESFVQAWKSLPGLQDPGAFPGWIHRIAWRQITRHWEARGMKLLLTPVDEAFFDESVSAAPAEIRDDLRRVLEALPEGDLRLLRDKYEENFTYQELAEREGVSISTIRDRLVGARDRLTGVLRRNGLLEEFRRIVEARRHRGAAGTGEVDA
jgi:RNA polymerase sigma factor (sigma-70 family)